jgi:hypothetical protein
MADVTWSFSSKLVLLTFLPLALGNQQCMSDAFLTACVSN